MKSFRELVELRVSDFSDTVAFTFGRFNPPTIGHEKLITKLAKVSGSNPYFVFPSQTQNPKKDPLPFALKIAYMRKMFPKHAKNIIADAKVRTALDVIVKLYDEGYKNVIMVVGSDRVKEFSTLFNNYNGVQGKRHGFYKFDNIKVVSAGQRDPDAEGAEGMSATKMRDAAMDSDFESFSQGVPSGFRDAKKLYLAVRKNMGIREQKDLGQLDDYESMRDEYLTGKIWNVGDIVEVNGVIGEIVRKGTNYVSFSDDTGKINKAWLHEINHHIGESVLKDLSKQVARLIFGKKLYHTIKRMAHKERYKVALERLRALKNDVRRVGGWEEWASRKGLRNTGAMIHKGGVESMLMKMAADHADIAVRELRKVMDKTARSESLELESFKLFEKKKDKKYPSAQDPDVDELPGSQPKQYYKGVEKDKKDDRAKHFARKQKASDDDPSSYVPAPGDKGAKTKPSTHTKKFKQMYGEGEVDKTKEVIKREKESDKRRHDAMMDRARTRDAAIKNQQTEDSPCWDGYKQVGTKKGKTGKTVPNCVPEAVEVIVTGKKVDNNQKEIEKELKKNGGRVDYVLDNGMVFSFSNSSKANGFVSKVNRIRDVSAVLQEELLDEKIEGLVKKAEKSGMPYGILKKVYDRGMAAWRTGHRPGTTPQQWAFARVNSFVTKSSGTWGKADKDLASKVRGSKKEEYVAEEEMKCPPATKSVDINTKNRNSTIKNHMYGPLNVDEPGDYWEKIAKKWDTTVEAAKKSKCGNCVAFDISPRMDDCMPGKTSDGEGRLGYCWMHHFKCHSARSCDTWAKGGPINKDEVSHDWQERAFGEDKDFGMIPKKKLPGHEVLGPVAESLVEENQYRVGSEKYFEFFRDKRRMFKEGSYEPQDDFDNDIMEGDLGKFSMYKGEMVALDCPMINEAEYKGKEVELNKPKAGGSKKYYVYVKNPATGNVKKVEWGDTTGLKIKLDDLGARKSFAARHKCDQKKDKTKPGYWACNIPRYAKQLGLSNGGNFFW